MGEVCRREIVTGEMPRVRRPCIVCGGEVILWFNGGELDQGECCGHLYRLASPDVYFEVVRIRPSEPKP